MNSKIVDIYSFFEILTELPEIEREIIFNLYHNGRMTFRQLINNLKTDDQNLRVALTHLIEKDLITKYILLNVEFYEISAVTTTNIWYERFPAGPVIPLVYQYNLISDSKRTDAFRLAIEKEIKTGDIVIDLGCGTGILSIFAAQRGAYVFAVEIDPFVADAAEYFIKNSSYASKIQLIRGDARTLKLDVEADVIICEMLDTALIAELQVPVMNIASKKWLKPGGKVIPASATSYIELVHNDYSFYGLDFRLIHFEEYGARSSLYSLSLPYQYHFINFKNENPIDVDVKFPLKTIRDGVTNGLRLTTLVKLTEGITTGSSPWFNPPLILPFDDIPVTNNDIVEVELSYGLGTGFVNIKYSARIANKLGIDASGKRYAKQ